MATFKSETLRKVLSSSAWNDESDQIPSTSSMCLLEEGQMKRRRHESKFNPIILAIAWILSLIFVAVLTRSAVQGDGDFASGYATDFVSTRTALDVREQRFSGSPSFASNGEEYIPADSPSQKFIGFGPSVDAAWNNLTNHRYFLLTEEEAKQAWGKNYWRYWHKERGGYLGGLDVFHTLHCLNHIRMSFYPEIYKLDTIHGQMHQIHCIDHLRQMVQCNADLTLIPSEWFEGIGQNYINSNQLHTCRDFETIRAWQDSRFSGPLAVKPRYANGAPPLGDDNEENWSN